VVSPNARKQVVAHMKLEHSLSERQSCRLVGVSRTAVRYQPSPDRDALLRKRLKALAAKHTSYGYLFLHHLLRAEGLVVNKKRTYRLYKELGLQVRTKHRKKLVRPRQLMLVPSKPNQRWSMDFVSDQLSNGRRFRVLNVIDDHSREVIGQLTSFSITGSMVARFLSRLINERSKPTQIVCDNGTEFTCKAMFYWQQETTVKLAFIQPGKPTQNAFVESLNGKFRNECLNQYWFKSLDDATLKIDQWRVHYNTVRPHSSLNYQTPLAYAQQAA